MLGTSAAVLASAARTGDLVVATQGHRIRVPDLLCTLTVEVTVHHLDLLPALAGATPPEGALERCRTTLDGLLGHPCPCPEWSAREYLLKATSRSPLTEEEVATLGEDARRFPLFG